MRENPISHWVNKEESEPARRLGSQAGKSSTSSSGALFQVQYSFTSLSSSMGSLFFRVYTRRKAPRRELIAKHFAVVSYTLYTLACPKCARITPLLHADFFLFNSKTNAKFLPLTQFTNRKGYPTHDIQVATARTVKLCVTEFAHSRKGTRQGTWSSRRAASNQDCSLLPTTAAAAAATVQRTRPITTGHTGPTDQGK